MRHEVLRTAVRGGVRIQMHRVGRNAQRSARGAFDRGKRRRSDTDQLVAPAGDQSGSAQRCRSMCQQRCARTRINEPSASLRPSSSRTKPSIRSATNRATFGVPGPRGRRRSAVRSIQRAAAAVHAPVGLRSVVPPSTRHLRLRPHVREQDHVADAGASRSQHHQPVDADAAAARRRHAVFERADVIGVVVHRLLVAGVLGFACAWKRAAWSSASFSSEKPLAISRPVMKSSKRSVTSGRRRMRAPGRDLDRIVDDEGRLHSFASATSSNKPSCSSASFLRHVRFRA